MAQKQEEKALASTGQATEEQIKAWKAQHGNVYALEVTNPATGELHVGYFKEPKNTTKGKVLDLMADKQLFEAGKVLLANCWLGGSAEMKTHSEDSKVYFSTATGIYELFSIVEKEETEQHKPRLGKL